MTLAVKDLRLLTRDYLDLFWMGGFPLVFALFFGTIFSGGDGARGAMAVAVVDEDHSPWSQKLLERLEASAALKVQRLPRAEAHDAVRTGRLVAFVVLNPEFGQNAAFFGREGLALQVGIDPARRAEAGYLQGMLLEAVFALLQERFADPTQFQEQIHTASRALDSEQTDMPPEQRQLLKTFLGDVDRFLGSVDPQVYRAGPGMPRARIESVAVTRERSGPKSAFEIYFPSAVMWGLIGCVTTFAVSLVTERIGGTWLRLRIAPISWGQLLAGKGLACFLASLTVGVVLLLIGRAVFGVRLESPVGLVWAVVPAAICFVGITMLTSTMGKTQRAVAGASWGILLPFAMLGGGTVPLFMMPAWMQTASHVSPVKWGILALEGAIWRGFSLTEMLFPCGILLGIGVACFAGGVQLLSRLER